MKALQIVELTIIEAFLLVEGFGQTISEIENGLRDYDYLIDAANVAVTSKIGAYAAFVEFSYSKETDGPFAQAVESKLRSMELEPIPGYENEEYFVVVRGYGHVSAFGQQGKLGILAKSFDGRVGKRFKLVQEGRRFTLPPEAFDFELVAWGGASGTFQMDAPTVTDYEVRAWQTGQSDPVVFSTIGNGRDDFNKVPGSTCVLSSAQGSLREKRVISIDTLWIAPSGLWEKVEITFFEGSLSTTISFKKASEPKVRLAMRIDEGRLYLSVSGEDAANVEIEEGETLQGPWGPSISLLRPPKPSSLTVGEFVFAIAPNGPVRFYRPKVPYSPPVQ